MASTVGLVAGRPSVLVSPPLFWGALDVNPGLAPERSPAAWKPQSVPLSRLWPAETIAPAVPPQLDGRPADGESTVLPATIEF